MIGRRMKHLAATLTAAITATLALTGAASASTILYDTLHYTNDHLVDRSKFTFIGGQVLYPFNFDYQGADNFSLSGSYNITSVTADYSSYFGFAPAGGVLVEFFADDGGKPAASASHAVQTQSFTSTSLQSNGFESNWRRLTVDLTSVGIILGEGTWWMSVVPVDETASGDVFGWLGYSDGDQGLNVHERGGAHGYPGGPQNWEAYTVPMDLAMQIQGTLASPTCAPADLDCNGVVNVFDLLDLLGAWGPCDDCPEQECPADLDDNCTVNVFDLLELLANWG